MKKKVKSWAIVVEWEHEDGTWNTETITDVDSMTANAVDEFLTEYEKEDEWTRHVCAPSKKRGNRLLAKTQPIARLV
jgi:hypothetical protein